MQNKNIDSMLNNNEIAKYIVNKIEIVFFLFHDT